MIITELQRKQLEDLVVPLQDWLNKNCHPHTTIILDSTSAQLYEGIASTIRKDLIYEPR